MADPDIAGGSIIPHPLSFAFSPPSDPFGPSLYILGVLTPWP